MVIREYFKFEASVDEHNHEMMIGHDDISIKMFETMDFLPRTFESHGVTAWILVINGDFCMYI